MYSVCDYYAVHSLHVEFYHRSFMQVCQEALDLNGRLILTDQLLYQDELKNKFQQMQITLGPLLDIQEEVREIDVCSIPLLLVLFA